MGISIPSGIRAEIVADYQKDIRKEVSFHGSHKRNAYEDILSIVPDEDTLRIELSRSGLYDILPEALFHPVDRFGSLPANEYKERFAEEVEEQRKEEADARAYFYAYDKLIFDLGCAVVGMKSRSFAGNRVLSDIICDSLPGRYKSNRFVARAIEFMPRCRTMRGNSALIALMLRKIMSDEGIRIDGNDMTVSFEDEHPRYNCRLSDNGGLGELYLGNCYDENVVCYDVQYWNEESCDETFLEFVEEIKIFEDFLNDYFMGIETMVHFSISAHALPVRLSDDLCYNFLNYNTNL